MLQIVVEGYLCEVSYGGGGRNFQKSLPKADVL